MKFKYAFFAILVVLLVHAFLLLTDGYGRFYQIDIPMHLMGGFAIGMLGLAIHHQVSKKHHNAKSPWWYHAAFVVGFAMLVGVVWEFHEYIMDQTVNAWYHISPSQPSLTDTMKDLLDDFIGAVVAFFIWKD